MSKVGLLSFKIQNVFSVLGRNRLKLKLIALKQKQRLRTCDFMVKVCGGVKAQNLAVVMLL